MADAPVVVIGVGNPVRGDDGAGPEVARRLRDTLPGVTVLEHDGEPAGLLDAWGTARAAYVVDAVRTGAAAGTVHRVDALAEPLPAEGGLASTHGLGVREAVELGRALGRLPDRLVVLGIEAERFDHGAELSASVREGVETAIEALRAELADM